MLLSICLLVFICVSLVAWGIIEAIRHANETSDERFPADTASTLLRRVKPLLIGLAAMNRQLPLDRLRLGLSRDLKRAGLSESYTPDLYLALQETVGLAFFVYVLLMSGSLFLWVAAGITGFFAPRVYLSGSVRERRVKIVRELPFVVDLLTLSVEAGMDFFQALGNVIERGRAGPLKAELETVQRDMRFGRSRSESLTDMGDRLEIDEVTSVVAAVIQSEELGTGLAKTLRLLSGDLRGKRMAAAEKAAGQAPVKLLAPMFIFIFPCVFLIIFAPMIIRYFGWG